MQPHHCSTILHIRASGVKFIMVVTEFYRAKKHEKSGHYIPKIRHTGCLEEEKLLILFRVGVRICRVTYLVLQVP